MRKLRVGVWVNDDYNIQTGGAFSYYTVLIEKLKQYSFTNADLIFISDNPNVIIENANFNLLKWKLKKQRSLRSLSSKLLSIFPFSLITKSANTDHKKKQIEELNSLVDVIYYLTPGCEVLDFPYVFSLWDLGHVSMYPFPEVADDVYDSRKKYHDVYAQKALMIFAESETGKRQIIDYLNINPQRIKVVPMFSSQIIEKMVSAQRPILLNENSFFIHYPAQFWAHKNHFSLILALPEIIKKYPDIKLVLTGSDKGNKKYIKKNIAELKLEDAVLDLGFVSTEELKWLYLNSQGLVMPTFLGPTNMPLLEAAELGCPVACSNLPGHIEQLGDYGYYFDPSQSEDISKQVCLMIKDRKNNASKEYHNIPSLSTTLVSIDNALTDLRNIRFCWGN